MLRTITATVFASACSAQAPDAICSLGFTPSLGELVIASPSLECYSEGPSHTNPDGTVTPGALAPAGSCPSTLCLAVPLSTTLGAGAIYPPLGYGLSTTMCNTDDDCPAEAQCPSGFACGVPPELTVGDFCCEKLCVCRDYVPVPDGGLPVPAACDPSVSTNACCNLSGRTNNPAYPLCTT